nr:hypothetical protein [Tanacetum cinerariifolium]
MALLLLGIDLSENKSFTTPFVMPATRASMLLRKGSLNHRLEEWTVVMLYWLPADPIRDVFMLYLFFSHSWLSEEYVPSELRNGICPCP